MYALKMVALACLAATCIAVFVIGYESFTSLSDSQKAIEEAHELHNKITEVINGGIKENQSMTLEVPEGYTLQFEKNHISINGTRFPKEENYYYPIKGPENLGPGASYELLIRIVEENTNDWMVRISEVG